MAIVEDQMVEVRWNSFTRKHYLDKGYEFTKFGDTFSVDIKDLLLGSKSNVLAVCDWCDKTFSRPYERLNRKNNKHHYCTNKCQLEHSTKVRNDNRLVRKCEQCNEDYFVKECHKDTSRFCSLKCMASWQKIAFKGENSPIYVERIPVKCDWCSNEILRTKSHLKTVLYNFCNDNCRQNWHRDIFMTSEESMKRNRKTMLSNLSNGNIKMTKTKPHLQINELLDEMNVEHIDEKVIYQYSIDVYLPSHDLYIEINGGYWHCDNRIYKNIEHDHQLNRIIGDKRKRTYFKNNLGKNILYLWEKDVLETPLLCKDLINLFIENKGLLKNYHSFNYYYENSKITLNNSLITPYMEKPYNQIKDLIDTSVREKVTSYDSKKHITFNCEFCGKEKQQPILQYNKAKQHFCSIPCRNRTIKRKKAISI